MSELTGPDSVCHVDGCDEPAVRTPRATIADDVEGVGADPGQLVPLCAAHAEQADAPPAASAAGVVDPTDPTDPRDGGEVT